MGLDFVVLQRPHDNSVENWPGHELDARRADDPDPLVQDELRKLHHASFSPEGLAASAEFNGWSPLPRPIGIVGYLLWPLGALFIWPIVLWTNWRAKRRDARRVVPSFEAWLQTQLDRTPPPIVLDFGPNCPPGGKPNPAAVVQWYGFRGKVIEPTNNVLVQWWASKHDLDFHQMLYGDGFEDGPQSGASYKDLELGEPTIGDMAGLFRDMRADCEATFPELVPPADAAPWDEAPFGPYPDRNLDEAVSPVDLTCIRGAATFFAFWEGRRYKIAPDY